MSVTGMLALLSSVISMEIGSASDVANTAKKDSVHQVTLESVAKAWKARELRTKTVRFSWKLDKADRNRWTCFSSRWLPEQPHHLQFGAGQVRYESLGWSFDPYDMRATYNREVTSTFNAALWSYFQNPATPSQRPQRFTSLFDGVTRKDFFAAQDGQYPRGAIYSMRGDDSPDSLYFRARVKQNNNFDSFLFAPLLLAYRALHDQLGDVRLDNCQLSDTLSMVAGRSCVVMIETVRESSPRLIRKYWLDLLREFVVVRYIGREEGQRRGQLDIQYKQDPNDGWIPVRWTAMLHGGVHITSGTTYSAMPAFVTADVTDYSVNPPLSEKSLELTYPPGSWVIDTRNDTDRTSVDWSAIARTQWYLVNTDGTLRYITKEEWRNGPTYAELLATESGTAAGFRWSYFSRTRTLWIVLAFLLAGIAITRIARRVRRAGVRPQDA